MDPVAGISLTAAVLHLLKFGIDTVTTIREVYEQGVIGRYDVLNDTTRHLEECTQSLQQSLQNSNPPSSALAKEDKELLDLGRKCERCAQELLYQLRKLKLQSQPRSSVLDAMKGVARAVWKKDKIEKVDKQLKTYQSTLDTSLLLRLGKRFDVQSLRTNESFASLDGKVQHVINCLVESRTSLTALIVDDSERTRSHTTAQIQHLEQLQINDRLYDEVIKSLFYPDIFSRQEQVDYAFDGLEDSYEWIFQGPRTREMPLWNDFAAWLNTGQGMYWINGKAGSGKSTLMNYICQHHLKQKFLAGWSVDGQLLTPTYFFWAAGSRLQKSVDGLLRSLIYQMLKECRQLLGCLKSRLVATLADILKQSQLPIKICMFIDGLDEMDGPYDKVLKMLRHLANQENVKICLSSRSLLVFEEAFHGVPGFRLQDLTRHSITAYINDRLSDPIQRHVYHKNRDEYRAKWFVHDIAGRAEGVFLWAVIVVREVRDGLQGLVDLDKLKQAIDSLPSELEDLFMLMLDRIKPVFQRDAAQFLQIALEEPQLPHTVKDTRKLTLCTLYFVHSQRVLRDGPFKHEKIPSSDLAETCNTLKLQVLSHTAGLLELTPRRIDPIWIKGIIDEDLLQHEEAILRTEVNFIHRTAQDFLTKNERAQSFLARTGYTEAQLHLAFARGKLAQIAQFSGQYRTYNAYYLFLTALEHIASTEQLVGAAQTNFMRSIVRESYFERYALDGNTVSMIPPLLVNENGMIIDVVAVAAKVGMTLYICELLDIPIVPSDCTPHLARLLNSFMDRPIPITVRLTIPSHQEDSNVVPGFLLGSSSYRQTLNEYLRRDKYSSSDGTLAFGIEGGYAAQDADLPKPQYWAHFALAETYLLFHCTPDRTELVRALLQAGANPMVKFLFKDPVTDVFGSCFWHGWLDSLRRTTRGHILPEVRHVTSKVAFDTTIALIVHGASVNLWTGPIHTSRPYNNLKRGTSPLCDWALEIDATAMFLLEDVFDEEPDFLEFATAMEPFVQFPARKLHRIAPMIPNSGNPQSLYVPLTSEHCDTLWPLIEQAERTRNRKDVEVLEAAMAQIWKAYQIGKIEGGADLGLEELMKALCK
ncbi:MAG: hypothetical protein Q9178_006251 [Gyalolechia marmorata]